MPLTIEPTQNVAAVPIQEPPTKKAKTVLNTVGVTATVAAVQASNVGGFALTHAVAFSMYRQVAIQGTSLLAHVFQYGAAVSSYSLAAAALPPVSLVAANVLLGVGVAVTVNYLAAPVVNAIAAKMQGNQPETEAKKV